MILIAKGSTPSLGQAIEISDKKRGVPGHRRHTIRPTVAFGGERMVKRFFSAATALLAILVFDLSAKAANRPIEDFYGRYIGRTISVMGEGLSSRDLNVTIKPHKKGFTLDWTTVTRKADGEVKSKSYSINFQATKRTGIYASAMRNDVFGGAVPLDPLGGDPYVWAGIDGETLTVHAMLITDDGGYEMQVYDRTLTEDGLLLRFSRIRDGQQLKLITGTLKKVSD